MNDTNKTFLKKFLELRTKLHHKNDEVIKNYGKFKFDLDKEVLLEELNNNQNNANFLIKTQAYQRFDSY